MGGSRAQLAKMEQVRELPVHELSYCFHSLFHAENFKPGAAHSICFSFFPQTLKHNSHK